MAGPRADTWMPFYIGDYLRDTGRLTTEGHGAYVLMIFDYWTSGAPLPDDDDQLAAITKLGWARWRRLRPILAQFFAVGDGVWRHGRIDAEIEISSVITEERSKAGKAGANARWGNGKGNGKRMANASVGLSQTDAPSPVPKEDSEEPSGSSSGAVAPPAIDLKAIVFGQVLDWLKETSGRTEAQIRPWLGKCCRDFGDGNLIMAAATIRAGPQPVDPFSALIAKLQQITGSNGKSHKPSAHDRTRGLAEGLAGALMALGVEGGGACPGEQRADFARDAGGAIVIDAERSEGSGGAARANA